MAQSQAPLCWLLARRSIRYFSPVVRGNALTQSSEDARALSVPRSPKSKAFGVLVRALKQRVEAIAETRLPAARPNQGSHAIVYGVGRNAADRSNVGARDLKKFCRIWIVQQSQEQMLQGDVTMGPLLGCSSGAP
jgi:hypothetical protein